MAQTVIILPAGTTSFTPPPDWTKADLVETWGPGGGGGANYVVDPFYGQSGGTGGYSAQTNVMAWSAGVPVACTIPFGGIAGVKTGPTSAPGGNATPCFIGASTLAASVCGANGGNGGASGASQSTATTGKGATTTGVPVTTINRAGVTAAPNNQPGAAGGAPGHHGVGGPPQDPATSPNPGGGAGDAGFGGAGGTGGNGVGTNGVSDPNGGGGGASPEQIDGTNGGTPGAGGGGGGATNSNIAGGKGGDAAIRITYTPAESGTGTLVSTLANAVFGMSALLTFKGPLASTLGSATYAGDGTVMGPSGALAATLDDASMTGAGGQTYSGSLATAFGTLTFSAAMLQTLSGSLSSTLGDATFAGTGNQMPMLHGTLAATLANAVAAFSGVTGESGTLAATLANVTASLTGTEEFSGTLARMLANATMLATGKQNFTAALTSQLDDAAFAGAAVETFKGSLTTSLGNATADIHGVSSSAVGPLIATLADFGMVIEAHVPMAAIPFSAGYWITHLRRELQR